MQQPRMAEKFFKNASGYGISIFHPRGKDMKKSQGNAEIHSSSTKNKSVCLPVSTFFLLLLTAVCSVFLLTACGEEMLESVPDVSKQAQKADNFIQLTITRISDAWESAAMEFRLAFQNASDKPVFLERDIKAQTELATEKFIDGTVQSIEDQVEEAKEQLFNSAGKAISHQTKNLNETGTQQLSEISSKTQEFSQSASCNGERLDSTEIR